MSGPDDKRSGAGRSGRHFLLAVSGVFGVKVLGSALAMAVQIALARALGIEQFGYYAYVITWMNVVLLFARMGYDSAALRFIGQYRGLAQWGRLRGYVSASAKAVTASSVLISVVGAFVVFALSDLIAPSLAAVAWVACCMLPVSAATTLTGSVLQGFDRVLASRVLQEVVRPALLLGVIGVWWGLRPGAMLAPHAAIAHTLAFAATLAVLVALLSRTMHATVPLEENLYERSLWRRTAFRLALISGLHLLLTQTDILMLGVLSGTNDAGMYAVASKIATLTLFGLHAANTLIAPRIARLHAEEKMDQLQALITVAARLTFLVTILLTVGVAGFAGPILETFGSEFVASKAPLFTLMAGQIVNALVGAVGFLLTMTGRESIAGRVIGLSAIANVVLNLLLIPRWGPQGAAIATAITTAAWNLVLAWIVRKQMGLRPSIL